MTLSITVTPRENQALGLGRFAIDFLADRWPAPDPAVFEMVERLHLDSVACGVSALACGTNAPTALRREALEYSRPTFATGAALLGSKTLVAPEKAALANSAAVREWDANGTNFGYNPARGHVKGEFGHNDFYPVAVAAAQLRGFDGRRLLMGMLLIDEIRGRLAEVFSLKDHKIDHVLHGAIASAATYGAMLGASAEQIESAIGLVVAHHVPFRAIRHGKQLSDSKGASAAISIEAAMIAVHRAMKGFVGPGDIFRNSEAVFCLFEPRTEPQTSPFELVLSTCGRDFAVMGMHFKLGLYEHQSAGAIQGLHDLLAGNPALGDEPEKIAAIRITIYEPAFGIIGDPAKRDPRTRQSADHSMVYIVATLLRKAMQTRKTGWRELMLLPDDYSEAALFDPLTRRLMERIDFRHGGPEYDRLYPDGIPTTVEIDHRRLGRLTSGLVMYPLGHARNSSDDLQGVLEHKFRELATLGVDDVEGFFRRFSQLDQRTPAEIRELYDFRIRGVD